MTNTIRTLLHTLTDGNPQDPSKVVYVYVFTDGEDVHRFESGSSRWGVDVSDIPASPIVTSKYWPRYLPSWEKFTGSTSEEGIYIKKPWYMHDESRAWWERERTTRDLVINEHVRANPHPNVLNYEGAVVHAGHVSAVAFRKLKYLLHDVVKDKFGGVGRNTTIGDATPPLDTVMRDIRAGVKHLLSIGLVYLDISPRNIMWDEDNENWVLIDLSECYAPGTVFYDEIPGTPRWKDVHAQVADESVLEPMLAKLENYVNTGKLPPRE